MVARFAKESSLAKMRSQLFRPRSEKDSQQEQKGHFSRLRTIGGVFTVAEKDLSVKSINTLDTKLSYDSAASAWSSSGSDSHHVGSPKVARSKGSRRLLGHDAGCISAGNAFGDDWELGDDELLGRIMLKSRKLPKDSGAYASNHVMINSERIKKRIAPLSRMTAMDEAARRQAIIMAEQGALYHSTPADLREQLGEVAGLRIGENVAQGSDLRSIHESMMDCTADKNNMLDRRFLYMGVGTAKGSDGTLYLCQIFQN